MFAGEEFHYVAMPHSADIIEGFENLVFLNWVPARGIRQRPLPTAYRGRHAGIFASLRDLSKGTNVTLGMACALLIEICL
jgi:hypothetical protein